MTEAATGAAVPAELQGAMLGFVKELKAFRADIETKLGEQDKRMSMIDRKTALRNRTPLAVMAEVEAPHQKAFAAYLRCGDDSGMRGLAVEEKGISTFDGGFLASPVIAERVQNALRATGSLRSIATVVQIDGGSFESIVETDTLGSAWAREAAAETDAGNVARVAIELHELAAMPKASQRLLDDAAFDVEGWIAGRIADRFAAAEAAAFLTGDGVDKPVGVLEAPQVAIDSDSHQGVGTLAAASATKIEAYELIDLVYALAAAHRANAAFVINSKVAAMLRKMRDSDGRFLWADSLSAGEPARLLGYPVLVSEDMPEPASGGAAVLFGDFHAGYTIAERPDLRVLRDPFSAKPHVLFYATKRVGGGVVDGRAIKRLNFA